MDLARTTSLLAATLTLGLAAGLFFAFSSAVMPGLARAGDRTMVETMQRINVAIVNPAFLVCFLGALLSTAVAVALHLGRGATLGWLIAALVLYVATIAVTGGLNVPLNNRLDGFDLTDATAAREVFEAAWVRWNLVRTATSTAAFACAVAALLTR